MPAANVHFRIALRDAAIRPGKRVIVQFETTITEPIRVRGAHVAFHGFEETWARYSEVRGNITIAGTAREQHTFLNCHNTFFGDEPKGRFYNLIDWFLTVVGLRKHAELPAGDYRTELEIDLPDPLLESFVAAKSRRVYEAAIFLDIPGGRNLGMVEQITVRGPISPQDPKPLSDHALNPTRGLIDHLFAAEVQIEVDLDATTIGRGDKIRGKVKMKSGGAPRRVRAVVCKVIRRETCVAQGHRGGHVSTVIDSRFPWTRNVMTSPCSFEISLPDEILPTLSGARFTIEHELMISLDTPGAKNARFRIPIVIV